MARRITKSAVRKNTRKRTVRKYRRNKGGPTIVTQKGLATSSIQRVKLRYMSIIDHVASTTNEILYRGNAMYDPEVSVGGNQPVGFDQWAAFYSTYRVIGAKAKLTYVSDGTNPAAIMVLNANTSGTSTAAVLLSQQKFSKTKFFTAGNNYPVTLSMYMTTAKVFGMRKEAVFSEDNFLAPTGSAPADQWFFQWRLDSLDGSTNVDGYIQAQITYYCEFLNPKLLPQS